MSSKQLERIGLFAFLAENFRGSFGRTALMKICYFMQTVGEVDLGYDFTLYSYGPFDSEVLSDLRTAEAMNVVKSEVLAYQGGYGYLITPDHQAAMAKKLAGSFLRENEAAINRTVKLFGDMSAGDLELLSTLLFVRRESKDSLLDSLVQQVKRIKPHFENEYIRSKAIWLRDQRIITLNS